MYPPVRAHWRHLANTIELVLPSAYSSPQPKWQIDRFGHFAQLTAESPYTLQWAPLSQDCKIAPSHGGSGPPSNTISWAHPRPQSKQHLDQFSRFCTDDPRVFLYFTMVRPFPPSPQNCPFPWGSGSPSNTWFFRPTQVLNPNGISIASAVSAGLTSVTDRHDKPTDRPTDHAILRR